ncbi:MAG: protein-methionine-sulfoxide reductase catalytic subunit MsrP [Dechloromonas sp.]|nr:protein-methionine-sulfoxide reductase catalytic subunit MsrP [Dechloromonas sp.]
MFRFPTPPASEITPEAQLSRRRLLLAAGALALPSLSRASQNDTAQPLPYRRNPAWDPDDKPTPFDTVSSYNNFYEFGPDKDSPKTNAQSLRISPWTVTVDGEIARPQTFDIDEIIRWGLEERIYRLRCVEGWSAVIPWLGLPMSELIRRVQPTSKAKYVVFTSLADPAQMPRVRLPVLDWPYTEALRIDEAANPLTLLAVGMYGNRLPRQNGAPIRLVVPWKYGFKSAKSVVRIHFAEQAPRTTWNKAAPHEYGFYANVNPDVAHRRWSQESERRLGEFRKRPTLPFNGYAEQVAHLYAGMDLRRNY